MLTLDEAKSYLRVDSNHENDLINSLLLSAQVLCCDVARLKAAEWSTISAYTEKKTTKPVIQGIKRTKKEVLQMKELLRVGVYYALGYLYEHREEGDHHDLIMTLRNLLFSIREGVF